MRKISNPYDPGVSRCFGCSDSNPIGLKLRFYEENGKFFADWEPTEQYTGFVNLLHGGIAATLLDEIGAWFTSVICGTACVTSSLNVKYLKPVYISRGTIKLTAEMESETDREAIVECKLYDGEGNLCVTSSGTFFKFPEAIARRKYFYPGKEAFYKDL